MRHRRFACSHTAAGEENGSLVSAIIPISRFYRYNFLSVHLLESLGANYAFAIDDRADSKNCAHAKLKKSVYVIFEG